MTQNHSFMSSDEKIDQIITDLSLIKKALKIVKDRDIEITDFNSSIRSYEEFVRDELKLEQITINNQKSAIRAYLNYSNGIINKDTVKEYLESDESESWKSNQVKALRRYIRDFLKLGNWIEQFSFSKTKAKIKQIPTDENLAKFCLSLPYQTQLVFFVLLTSGLRIGEVLSLRVSDMDFETNMINASTIHKGNTKSSWISFITKQAAVFLSSHIETTISYENDDNPKIFSVSQRTVQHEFQKVSEDLGLSINPHLLRTVFTEKCAQAGVKDKYIDAFCGRVPQGVLAKNYTDYSPQSLRVQYEKAEPYLTLKGITYSD